MGAFLSKIGLPLAAIVLFCPLVGHFAGYLAGWLSTTPFAFTFNHGGDQHGGRWCRVEYGPLWLMRPPAIPKSSEPQPPPYPPPRPVSNENHQHPTVEARVAACGRVKAPPPERPLGIQACQPPSDSMVVTNHLEKIWL